MLTAATASPVAAGGSGLDTRWQQSVVSPRTTDVRPVAVTAVSRAVTRPGALVTGRGVTTLTRTADGPAP